MGSSMPQNRSPSILPKLIVATICVYLSVISLTPPRTTDHKVELKITQKAPNKFQLRYLYENILAIAVPSNTTGYAQWYGLLFLLFGPLYVPFLIMLVREWHAKGARKYAQWTLLDRLSAAGIIVGSAIRLWSFRCLGEYFTFNVTVKEDQALIRTGPYKVLIDRKC